MHRQVVDKNGTTISFWKSVGRYVVFAVAYYLNAMLLPSTRTRWVGSTLISLVVFWELTEQRCTSCSGDDRQTQLTIGGPL
jgi:hypothetical protein